MNVDYLVSSKNSILEGLWQIKIEFCQWETCTIKLHFFWIKSKAIELKISQYQLEPYKNKLINFKIAISLDELENPAIEFKIYDEITSFWS